MAKKTKHITPSPLELFELTNRSIIDRYKKGIESAKLNGNFAQQIYQECLNLETIRQAFIKLNEDLKSINNRIILSTTSPREIVRKEVINACLLLDTYHVKNESAYNFDNYFEFYFAASLLEGYYPLPEHIPSSDYFFEKIQQSLTKLKQAA